MIRTSVMNEFLRNRPMLHWYRNYTVWKVSLFGVFLLRIFPRSEWIRARTTPNGHFSCSVSQLVTSYDFKSSHRRCPIRMVLWKIFQKSQKSTCDRVSLKVCKLIKKGTVIQVFSCEFFKIWLTLFLKETPLVTASRQLFPQIQCFPVFLLYFIFTFLITQRFISYFE